MAKNEQKKSIEHKKVGKLQLAVLLRTLLPMLCMGILLALISGHQYRNAVVRELEKNMSLTAQMVQETYEKLYPGDYKLIGEQYVSLYKGEQELTGNYEIIDHMREACGYEISLFYGNTRILTTLCDTDGKRAVATGVNQYILEETGAKQQLFLTMDVQGQKYYSLYYPLYNSGHTLIGMIGIAKNDSSIRSEIFQDLLPVWLVTLVCLVLAVVFSLPYTNRVLGDIKAIKIFLQGMISGELNNDMTPAVLKRGDELGEMGRDVVDMQNAIRVLVEQDTLTGLYNRRYGGARLRRIQHSCQKTGMPYAVAIGDIDFFKKVNDTYGHEAGDIVLKTIARIMKNYMYGRGIVARWGGEEFLLVFDRMGQNDAEKELWRLLQQIRDTEIPYQDKKIRVTMTFGIIDGGSSDDYGELLRRADEMLYFGKENGRNRVVHTLENGEHSQTSEEKEQAAEREYSPAEVEVTMTGKNTVLPAEEEAEANQIVDAIMYKSVIENLEEES